MGQCHPHYSSRQGSLSLVSMRLPSGDPTLLNKNLRGIHVVEEEEEEDIYLPYLGPWNSAQELQTREREGRETYYRRRETERKDPPKPKPKRGKR